MNPKLIKKLAEIKNTKKLKKLFLAGSSGQIGQEIIPALSYVYGQENLLLTDIVPSNKQNQQFEILDCLDEQKYISMVKSFAPCMILHLPAILSGNSEKDIYRGIQVNQETFLNAIKAAESVQCKLFVPSSIAAYGFNSEEYRQNVSDMTYQRPETIYGIMKLFIELMGNYMKNKRCIDFRSLRYPGVLSPIMPDGGTTDYSIEMMYKAVKKEKFVCYIENNVELPFFYIDDLISETIRFLEADQENLNFVSYNIGKFSLSPEKLFDILFKKYPEFEMAYQADFRNEIAKKWPASIDYQAAIDDWGYSPEYGEQETIEKMLESIKAKINQFFH